MSEKSPAIPATMIKRPSRIAKDKVEVELIFHDGTNLTGCLFRGHGQRVQDLLNEEKTFLPLLQSSGEVLLISKAAIAICKPLDQLG